MTAKPIRTLHRVDPAISRPRRSRLHAPAILLSLAYALASGFPAPAQESKPQESKPQESKPQQPKPAPSKSPTRPTSPTAPVPAVAPPAATPAQPPAPREKPEWGPYVTRTNSKDWRLTAFVRLDSDSPDQYTERYDPNSGRSARTPSINPFEFETASIVYPLVPETSGSSSNSARAKGVVKFDDVVVGESFQVMRGSYHAGTRLLRFDTAAKPGNNGKISAREVSLEVEIQTTCSRVAFDEGAAAKLGWPKGPWPEDAALSLAPQLYVEQGVDAGGRFRPYADEAVTLRLKQYLEDEGIKDPASSTPVAVAKAITRGVWADLQPSGDGLKYRDRTAELSGVELRSPQQVLEDGRGSEHELTVVMAALMRKAGLPTRTVIGFDVNDPRNNKFLKDVKKEKKLRSWVEFYLYDEARNTYNWVPIDVVRLRRGSSKPPAGSAADRPVRYFGTNPDLEAVVPFALHFHPPTDVASYGAAAFFGWFVTPKPPDQAYQAITFRADIAPKRGGEETPADPEADKAKQTDAEKEREKDKEKKRNAARKLRGG